MNAKRIVFRLAGVVVVVAIAAGVFGNLSARVRHLDAIPQDAQAGAATVANDRTGGEPRGIALTATLQARGTNGLDAKRRIEDQIDSISKLAQAQGGNVLRGDSRFIRARDAGENPPLRETGFLIIQQVDIELPGAADRARLEAELARLDLATPR